MNKKQNYSKIWDRNKNCFIHEKEYGQKSLYFLYHTLLGRILLKYIVARPIFSRIQALYYKSFLSKKDIAAFVKKYGLDMKNYPSEYKNFNDFFIRKKLVGHKIPSDKACFLACADAKLSVYRIGEQLTLNIKGTSYSIKEILACDMPPWLKHGYCLVYRLSMTDCHRYIFSADGYLYKQRYIRGSLHSIRQISASAKSFASNSRYINYMSTTKFGKIIQIELGALLIGHIVNHKNTGTFRSAEEKGYFEFGASCIVQLLDKNVIIDEDLIRNSRKGIETKVIAGERIGYAGFNKET